MKVTQSACQVYHLRNIGQHNVWADIYIATAEGSHSGTIFIRSDYGSWDYYWGSCGCPFKQFLCEIGDDYLTNKFSYDKPKHWDTETFIKNCKEQLHERFGNDDIKKEDYEETLAQLGELEDFNSSESIFQFIENECDHVKKHWSDNDYPSGYITAPQLTLFIEKIWHPFINDVLKKELANVPA